MRKNEVESKYPESLRVARKLYEKSNFYKMYKDTYFSDKILKDALENKLRVHSWRGVGKRSYKEIHEKSTKVMRDLISEFAEKKFEDRELFWKMLVAAYIDPDSHGIRTKGEVLCTADGLLSIRRIYKEYGIDEQTVEEYKKYREVPIFYFPSEKCFEGINPKRASVFGDRIDHTLYDIKMYLDAKTEEEKNNCRLISAYNCTNTKDWLDAVGSFKNLVEWYNIGGIFVDENYNVFDIEKGQHETISGYMEKYSWDWSPEYYDNLKKYIEQFMDEKRMVY